MWPLVVLGFLGLVSCFAMSRHGNPLVRHGLGAVYAFIAAATAAAVIIWNLVVGYRSGGQGLNNGIANAVLWTPVLIALTFGGSWFLRRSGKGRDSEDEQ